MRFQFEQKCADGSWEQPQDARSDCDYPDGLQLAASERGEGALVTGRNGLLTVAVDRLLSEAGRSRCNPRGVPELPIPRPPSFGLIPQLPQLSVTASRLRRSRNAAGMTLTVRCGSNCAVAARGSLRGRGLRSSARSHGRGAGNGPAKLRLRFRLAGGTGWLRRSRGARRRTVRVGIRLQAVDAYGFTVTRTLRIRRAV